MIKLLRIDDRLVHGQVALTWTPSLGADCLVVANDKTAKDEFLKMTMNLAKPASAKLLIKSLDDTIKFLSDERSKHMKIFVLVNSVQDAAVLAEALPEIKSINFGGIRGKEGSKLISKAIASMTQISPSSKNYSPKASNWKFGRYRRIRWSW
jgi:fructoselysine and glucoselysine-specific PTS system IIB component